MRHICTLLLLAVALRGAAQLPLATPLPAGSREVRAVWLTTLFGLDWPRHAATTDEGCRQQRQELCEMLDGLQRAGINTVLFQARLRATTAYASDIEPWDGAFSGTPGRAPAYDPLKVAVEECHRRGMEIHAWVVVFPIGKVAAMKALGRQAIAVRHPELCQRCGDRWMMDPGVPATADYLAGICREITQNYDVDGIHLDYIRYPERGIAFDDMRTYRRYGGGQPKAAWRRDNVTRCVKAIHDAVKAVRPWVKLSCSPVGKYADLPRQSSYGWNARDAVGQDAKAWLRDGLMDWLFPMMYFDGQHFYPFAQDWKEGACGHTVVPGLGIYLLSENERDWPLTVVMRQMNVVRQEGLGGQAFFRARFLLNDVKGLLGFAANDFYRRPALTPALTWADSTPPPPPAVRLSREGRHTLRLSWQPVKDDTPVSYNVYRLTDEGPLLLAHGLRDTTYCVMPALPALMYERYAVCAMDAYGNESAAEVSACMLPHAVPRSLPASCLRP